ncbi:MAG: hypothetical protein L7F78_04195 [Syntrophales bacterium LBB04]|nr:hypothetical protein [Syntrophales bacterium LBB04]
MRRVILLAAVPLFMVSAYTSSSAPRKDAGGKTTKEIYELQEQCGKSAANFFKKQYGSGYDVTGFHQFYQNHYNLTLNKCFILMWNIVEHGDGNQTAKMIELYDVQENVSYGLFYKSYDEVKNLYNRELEQAM